MRIIGGELGGRRFPGPPSDLTRPTSDRVREAVASALDARDRFSGAHVLDLFAGTGALAFEALSRGADSAVLVEQNRRVARAIDASADALGLAARCRVIETNLLAEPSTVVARLVRDGVRADLVFADPPYASIETLGPLLRALVRSSVLEPGALLVVELPARGRPQWLAEFATAADYKYGDTAVVFLMAPAEQYPAP